MHAYMHMNKACSPAGSRYCTNKPGALKGLEKHNSVAFMGVVRLTAPIPVAHTGGTTLTPSPSSDDKR